MSETAKRFTLDGDEGLEAHLARVCGRVLTGVERLVPSSTFEGLLLAGGYGRGEGGVLRTSDGDRPYNDMEFYVFTDGNPVMVDRRFRRPLHDLGESLSDEAGLEVEFKALPLSKLRGSGTSMFYYDLVVAHRWVKGDDALLHGCEHHRDPERIPLNEATRLLMNRFSGLLYSLEKLGQPILEDEEKDFITRNLAKAQLALGDAVLTAEGRYHWSCRERHRRMLLMSCDHERPWVEELKTHHAMGVDFKLHPARTSQSRSALQDLHSRLSTLSAQVWLWLESTRLGQAFPSVRDYAESEVIKCPESPSWRNRLITARTFGLPATFTQAAARYPRERLFNALSLMLWEPEPWNDISDLSRLQTWLQTPAEDLQGLVAAYKRLWNRFN